MLHLAGYYLVWIAYTVVDWSAPRRILDYWIILDSQSAILTLQPPSNNDIRMYQSRTAINMTAVL